MQDYREIASRIADDFGANATYVEDLLRQFQHNPKSVDEEWGDYFQSLLGGDGSVKVESATGVAGSARLNDRARRHCPGAGAQPAPPAETTTGERIPIRGPALKIVENMESSLAVPTATSARQIQIKVLDENRRWVNHHLEAHGGGKTSYTHFIAWAMIKALEKYPQMNDGYEAGRRGLSRAPPGRESGLGCRRSEERRDAQPARAEHQGREPDEF